MDEIYTIFTNDETCKINTIKKKPKVFTEWSDILINEKQTNYFDRIRIKVENNKKKPKIIINSRNIKSEKLRNFSNDIAFCLNEPRQDIVFRIVKTIGFSKSSELCEESKNLFQNEGGMYTEDGKARTLGGIFFKLVKLKCNLTALQKKYIFYLPDSQTSARRKNYRKKQLFKNNKNEEFIVKKLESIKLN